MYGRVATGAVFKIVEDFFHDYEKYQLYLYRVANSSPSSSYEFTIEDFFKFDLFIFEGPAFDDYVIRFFEQVAFARKTSLLLIEGGSSKARDRIRSEYLTKNLIAEEVSSSKKAVIEYAFTKIMRT